MQESSLKPQESNKLKNLEHFFKPRSVAVIGASRKPRKFGHVIFKNFIDSEYKGHTYPINPNINKVLGFKTYSGFSVKTMITNLKKKTL